MAPPTWVATYTAGAPVTTSPVTATGVATAIGDVLVCYALTDDSPRVITAVPAGTATGLTWALATSSAGVASTANVYIWTATATTAQSGVTVTVAPTGGSSDSVGMDVLRFSGSTGVGAKVATHATGAPTLNVTTTKANSAIVVANVDWNTVSGTTRTWRANAGALTETRYTLVSSAMTIYGGYHANSGAVGTYAVGLTAPTGQTFSIAAVELLGSSSSAVSKNINQAVKRAAYY